MNTPTCPNCGGPVNEDGIESTVDIFELAEATAVRRVLELSPETSEFLMGGFIVDVMKILLLDVVGDPEWKEVRFSFLVKTT